MAEADPRHMIGANGPPAIDTWRLHIEDLLAEATGFLDGEPVASQEQADSIGKLLGMLREARKGADEQRKIEKKPHDDAAKAVQSAWMPILDRVELAETTAKKALAPFLLAEEARKQAEAAKARAEAEALQRAAMEALRVANASDLAAREEAERLLKDASKADKAANRAEKAKPMAAGTGRSVSLRSVWTAVIVDRREALNFYIKRDPDEFQALIQRLADVDVRAGRRSIPGVDIKEDRIAQ